MRRLLPEFADLDPAELYQGLTLTDGTGPVDARRSWVALGMVASLDGSATVGGRSQDLGGEADRIAFSRLRAACDAVLVGAGTVRSEDYRPVGAGRSRREDRQRRGLSPVARLVVVTRRLELPTSHAVFADPERRPLVVTHHDVPAVEVDRLAEVADIVQVGAEDVDLSELLHELAARGLSRVLCEGGPSLAGALHAQNLLDEVFMTLAPVVVGGRGPRLVGSSAELTRRMALVSLHEHEDELLLRYRSSAQA